MTPPLYPDLGKQARDVFGKGYHFGLIKLDIKTKTSNGVEFTSSGVANKETEKTFGSLETKYKFKDHGVTLAERWNTDNVIGTEITFTDICEGAKLALGANFIPHAGQRAFTLKADFRNEMLALNLDTNLQPEKTVIRGGAVLGYHGLLCGYQTAYDTSKKKLIENKVSMAFVAKEFVLMSSINSGQIFTGSVYHKVNPNLETAINLSWSADSNETNYAIAAKYAFDADGAVRFKVDNQSMVGLGYSQKLRKGITMFLSLQIDGKDLNEGSHKVGFALEMEA